MVGTPPASSRVTVAVMASRSGTALCSPSRSAFRIAIAMNTSCCGSCSLSCGLRSAGRLATGDLHPPPGWSVLQGGEQVAPWDELADLPPFHLQVRAGLEFDLLAAAH